MTSTTSTTSTTSRFEDAVVVLDGTTTTERSTTTERRARGGALDGSTTTESAPEPEKKAEEGTALPENPGSLTAETVLTPHEEEAINVVHHEVEAELGKLEHELQDPLVPMQREGSHGSEHDDVADAGNVSALRTARPRTAPAITISPVSFTNRVQAGSSNWVRFAVAWAAIALLFVAFAGAWALNSCSQKSADQRRSTMNTNYSELRDVPPSPRNDQPLHDEPPRCGSPKQGHNKIILPLHDEPPGDGEASSSHL